MAIFSPVSILFFIAHVTSALNSIALVVETVPDVTLILGSPATLTCNYNRAVYTVNWRYQINTSPEERLVTLDSHFNVGERSGPGYDNGRFNITDDYSLIIKDVQTTDEGTYICEVFDFETGSALRNRTYVTTIVIAELPFVRIAQCKYEVPSESAGEHCALHLTRDVSRIELTCSVVGAKPEVALAWESSMSSEYRKQGKNESKERTNGIFDQTLTVNVDITRSKQSMLEFMCIAEGSAVKGVANGTITVHIAKEGVNSTVITTAVISVIICALLFTLVEYGVWGKVKNRSLSKTEMIKKIKNMKEEDRVYLGVFGDKDAGKSSSIRFFYRMIHDGECTFDKSSDIWEGTVSISDGLRTRIFRDDKDTNAPERPEVISAILKPMVEGGSSSTGDSGITDDSDDIHYPIYVFDIKNKADWEDRTDWLKKFAEAVHDIILQYPMIVVTKASSGQAGEKGQSEEELIKKFIKKTKIPREDILVTYQSLDGTVAADEQTENDLLEFVLKCVANVDMQGKSVKKGIPIKPSVQIGRKKKYNLPSTSETNC